MVLWGFGELGVGYGLFMVLGGQNKQSVGGFSGSWWIKGRFWAFNEFFFGVFCFFVIGGNIFFVGTIGFYRGSFAFCNMVFWRCC